MSSPPDRLYCNTRRICLSSTDGPRTIQHRAYQHRSEYVNEFGDEFGSTLTGLPESRHGDALTWTKQWIAEMTTTESSS